MGTASVLTPVKSEDNDTLPADIKAGDVLMVHASFSFLKQQGFNTPESFLQTLISKLGSKGLLIIPSFTYCFVRADSKHTKYTRNVTPSAVGYISEAFRLMPEVKRTGSPTHSFCYHGSLPSSVKDEADNPSSPLGMNSLMRYFVQTPNSKILFAGTDFTSLSVLHYFEVVFSLPYRNVNPFIDFGYLSEGAGDNYTLPLKEVPGCSNGFIHLQKFMGLSTATLGNKPLFRVLHTQELMRQTEKFITQNPFGLLCTPGECKYCDKRYKAVNG